MKFGNAFAWIFAASLGACAAAPESGGAPAGAAPKAAATAPASLVGTRWKGVIAAGVDAAATPWVEFSEGRMSGFTGCNLFNGGWRSEGGQVRLGPMAMTKRGCMGPAGDIERRVVAVLSEQSRVMREGDKLVIVGPAGERFEFVAA